MGAWEREKEGRRRFHRVFLTQRLHAQFTSTEKEKKWMSLALSFGNRARNQRGSEKKSG
jgi:hypothetical protein